MEFTDPEQFEKNYNTYYNLFSRTAESQYGSELPDTVVDYLATMTNKGWF